MELINVGLKFAGNLTKRTVTDEIILHHAAGNGSVESIHNYHINGNGWLGIAYHFYVREDGKVYVGRPVEMVGGHTYGENNHTVGICFEGNFESEVMSDAQKKAGAELVTYVRNLYPTIKKVSKHKEYNATACPGKNFPFDYIAAGATQEQTPVAKGTLYRVDNEIIIKNPEEVEYTGNGIFTIVEEKKVNGIVYGKLKSGVGWVRLANAKKV